MLSCKLVLTSLLRVMFGGGWGLTFLIVEYVVQVFLVHSCLVHQRLRLYYLHLDFWLSSNSSVIHHHQCLRSRVPIYLSILKTDNMPPSVVTRKKRPAFTDSPVHHNVFRFGQKLYNSLHETYRYWSRSSKVHVHPKAVFRNQKTVKGALRNVLKTE